MTTGKVTSITTDWRGDTVRDGVTGISVYVPVYSTVDFDEAGGWLVIGDSDPLRYVAVDEDQWVELETVPGDAYEEGTPVIVWDPSVANGGAQVVEYVAVVEMDAGPVDAVIPHSLVPTSGLDLLIGATARIADTEDGDYFVDAILGREPQFDSDLLDLEALSLTASIVRTAETGNRVVITADGALGKASFYSGDPDETFPATINALDPGIGPPEFSMISGVTAAEPFSASIGLVSGATANDRRVYVPNLFLTAAPTTGGAANVNIGPAGQLRESTSSLRYKQDVEAVEIDPAAVLAMRPKTWRDRNAVAADPDTVERHVGFIAEDLEELGMTEFLTYDEQGRSNAIQYDRLSVALLALAQYQEKRIGRLEKLVDRLV